MLPLEHSCDTQYETIPDILKAKATEKHRMSSVCRRCIDVCVQLHDTYFGQVLMVSRARAANIDVECPSLYEAQQSSTPFTSNIKATD